MGVLRFRLLGFPVLVQPGFWLLALLLGSTIRDSLPRLLLLVATLFVSILAHELGHALLARRYGQEPVITLHMMGGLTSWRLVQPISRRATVVITLAGPAMGFALGITAAVLLYATSVDASPTVVAEPSDLIWLLGLVAQLNIFWSIINLLPVLPFDGGQVLAAALGPGRRQLTASVSLAVGLFSGWVLWRVFGLDFAAIILAVAGVSQFVAFVRSEKARPRAQAATEELLRRGERALDAENWAQAAAFGQSALGMAASREQVERAATLTAWAAYHLGNVQLARELVEQLGKTCDVALAASVYEASGAQQRAREVLEAARRGGDERPEVAAQLVRLHLESGAVEAAVDLVQEISDEVPSQDLREVARRVAPTAPADAAALFALVFERDGDIADALAALRTWLAGGLRVDALAFVERLRDRVDVRTAMDGDPCLRELLA